MQLHDRITNLADTLDLMLNGLPPLPHEKYTKTIQYVEAELREISTDLWLETEEGKAELAAER